VKIDLGIPSTGVLNSGTYENVTGTRRYVGGFMAPSRSWWDGWAKTPLAFTGNSSSMIPDASAYFDRSYSLSKPKLEYAGLYVFLKEFKDTGPMLETTAKGFSQSWKSIQSRFNSKRLAPRDAAEQFLNQQFGWKPFLNDLDNFYSTYVNASEIIKRITDENGKWERRHAKVKDDGNFTVISEVDMPVSSTSYAIPNFPTGFPADFFIRPPSYRITEDFILNVRASGKARYYRPEFDAGLPSYDTAWNNAMRWVKIYGLEVSPYHIWQAIPWTWLADWVSNLGSFIERLNDTLMDSIAFQYLFQTVVYQKTQKIEVRLPFKSGTQTMSYFTSYYSKQRTNAASPYGFRLGWDNLSSTRLAILGSLGITRKR
jgi:hypothetical protein